VHLLKVLILEFLSVDALTTRTVALGEIAASVSHALSQPNIRRSYPPWIMKPLITRWKPDPL
jgi:hypothetical protein